MDRFLVLLRHAEAEFGIGADRHRNLTARGLQQAKNIADFFEKSIRFDRGLWLVSAAIRTTQTGVAIQEVSPEYRFQHDPDLYNCDRSVLTEKIELQDPDEPNLAVLGHNPGISELASILSGSLLQFPPAAGVLLSGSSDSWADLTRTNWTVLEKIDGGS